MTRGPGADDRLGERAAFGIVALSAAYVLTGVAWLLFGRHVGSRASLDATDAYRAILEVLILLTAPLMVLLSAALYGRARDARRVDALASFGFMLLAVGITSGVHWVELTVTRRAGPLAGTSVEPVLGFRWPSAAFALDLFAWDACLGLALLLAARVVAGRSRLAAATRTALAAGGALCLAGVAGPASGDLRLQYPAIAGYAFVFPLACVLLGLHFRRSRVTASI